MSRELLRRVVDAWDDDEEVRYDNQERKALMNEIRDFLSTPEPEQDEEPEKYATGLIGFIQYVPDAGINFTLDEPDDDSYPFEPVYVHPAPRKPFVRLSEEEIMAIVRADPDFDEMMWDKTAVRFARAIENALEEKNK